MNDDANLKVILECDDK